MGQGAISVGWPFALVLIALAVIAAGAALAGRLGQGRAVLTASARAVLQLAVVSLLIAAVLRSWWATAGFILLMVAVAAATSARRVTTIRLGWAVLLPIAVGAVPVGALIVVSGAMPL